MRIIILLFIIFISGCSKKSESESTKKIENVNHLYSKNKLKNALVDSVLKANFAEPEYIISDSDEYVVFTGKIKNREFGIITITDSSLFLLQKINGKWIQTDSSNFENYARLFQIMDLNGDGIKDVKTDLITIMSGNIPNLIFISDKNGILHYKKDIELQNVDFDSTKKLLRSYYLSGQYGEEGKQLYKWIGDSIKLFRSVKYDHFSENKKTITFEDVINDKHITKVIKNPKREIYDTALWVLEEY